MFFGATSPTVNRGPRLVDLNLLPHEYRPKPFPVLSVGLAVLALGCAFLLYAAYYARTYTDLEIGQLTARVNQAEVVVRAATGDPAALARQDQLRAMRDDFNVLAQREISWGDVLQTIGDAPPGVVVNAISQAGFGVTVTGSASDSAAAATYLNKLRASNLFVDAALQISPATEVASPTPSATLVPPPPPPQAPAAVAPVATAIQPVQPVHPAPPVQPPVPARMNAPVPVQPPAAAKAAPTRTTVPTITPTPTITETSTPTATLTPAYNFALLSVQQIPTSNPMVGASDIKGTVVDLNGKPIGGLTIQVDSEGSPPWSSTRTTDATFGSFDFVVTHGKFKVYVVAGRSQPAVDLYTGADGVPGVYGYQVSFQATFTGTPSVDVIGSPTDTPTLTPTTSPSSTPISLGQNVASWGCTNSYLQNSPSTHLGNNSNLAIDGNYGTEWNASLAPSNGSQVIWQWSLPAGPTTCNDGRTAAGLPDSQDQIEGFQLIPDQNPAGATTHELWLYADVGCTSNLATGGAYFTWSGITTAGQILPLRFSPAVMVRCIIVRTLADPSFVAWEEIQIYQAVPPPHGFLTLTPTPTSHATSTPTITGTPPTPTSTPTPTLTASPTKGPSGTPTATASSTATASLTATASPTATLAPLHVVPGVNIAPTSGVIISTPASVVCTTPTPGPSSVCNAIDDKSQTFWAPTIGPDAQGITVSLVSKFIPTPDTIIDLRVEVYSSGTGGGVTYVLRAKSDTPVSCIFQSPPNGYIDHTQLDCPFFIAPFITPVSTPLSNILSASVLIFRGGPQDGSYGVREFQIYNQVSSSQIANPCRIGCPQPTLGSAPRFVATATSAGLGRGPGDSTVFAPNAQPVYQPKAADAPSPTPAGGTPIPRVGGPVDFTIVLEVASGTGY